MEGALHDARQIFDALHTVDALAKWTIDLALIGIMVQVYLLVRVPAVIVGRNVTSDDHHRYRIESSRRDACARICKPWAKMAQHNTGLARSSCIAIRCMRCDLFVAGGDKPNATLAQRIQQCNNRVAAQTKDHLNAKALQVFNQQIRRNPLFRLVFGLQTDSRVCRHDNAAPFFLSIHDYRTRQRIKNRSTSHPKFGHCAEWRSGSASAGGSSAATLHRRCVSANADDVGLSVTSALKDML